MVSVTTWTSPAIDARIVALKQTGISYAQIAAVICREFDTFVTKNMVLRRSRTILAGLDRGEKAANERLARRRKAEKAANDRLARRRKAEEAARMPKEPAPRPVNVPPPAVTLPPLASVALAFNYQSLMPPRPATPCWWPPRHRSTTASACFHSGVMSHRRTSIATNRRRSGVVGVPNVARQFIIHTLASGRERPHDKVVPLG